jgi:protein TonB
MKTPVAYLLAILLHVAILFGIVVSQPVVHTPLPEKKYLEVTLSAAQPAPAPAAVMPPRKAEPPPPPPNPGPPPLPPPPKSPPPPIKTDKPVLAPKPAPPPEIAELAPENKSAPTPRPPAPAESAPASNPVPTSTRTLPAINAAPANPVPGQYVNISQPSFQNRVEPDYPIPARRQHQQGSVVVGLYLNELGTLDKVEIVKSSGYPLLDEAAVEAMQQSQFHPAYQDKTPVSSHAEVTITFHLQ